MPSTNDSRDDSDSDEPGELNYVTTFDPDAGERASNAVITAIAALLDERPDELSPLYDVVDPDALDGLVDHAWRSADTVSHELWFSYEGFDVGVKSDGHVTVQGAAVPANAGSE